MVRRHFSGVTYAAPGGYRPLQLDVLVPATATPAPLVVWIHGGAWMFGDRRYLPETLRPNQLFDELLERRPRGRDHRLPACRGGAVPCAAA